MHYYEWPEYPSKHRVKRYGFKAGEYPYFPHLNGTHRSIPMLRAERLDAVQTRDELVAAQKECASRGDRDGAKQLKTLAQAQMRRYRAACLVIPWIDGDPPGDCKNVVCPKLWPLDLEPELDALERMIYLKESEDGND